MIRTLTALLCMLAGAGCAKSTGELPPVDGFDLQRYSGLWYEIARFPHRFERDLVAVTAEYTIEEDGSVTVVNRGYNPAREEWKTAEGRAYLKGEPNIALLKVTFFWPFYGTYKVIRLDKEDYSYAVVTSSTYDYFWILSRTPTMDEKTLTALMEFAKASGFDTSRVEFPDQTKNLPRKQDKTGGPQSVKSIYDLTVKSITGSDVRLSDYRGKVVMVVNTASKCGFTGQYAGLQALYDKYGKRGFVILGFPANDFLRQEPGTNEEIKEFCSTRYGVTFPMFAKISVKGRDQHPLYKYLTGEETNPEFGGKITWNFNKFLIGRDGKIVNRFGTRTKPEDEKIITAIEDALKEQAMPGH